MAKERVGSRSIMFKIPVFMKVKMGHFAKVITANFFFPFKKIRIIGCHRWRRRWVNFWFLRLLRRLCGCRCPTIRKSVPVPTTIWIILYRINPLTCFLISAYFLPSNHSTASWCRLFHIRNTLI